MKSFDSVILSGGGMESLVLCAREKAQGRSALVYYVEMDVSEREANTRAYALTQARNYGHEFHSVSADTFFKAFTRGEGATGYMPGYRHMLLSMGLQMAEHVGAREVIIGEHAEWPNDHPSTILFERMVGNNKADGELKPAFWQELSDLYNQTYRTDIQITTPFIILTKGEVALLGEKLGVEWTSSMTCRRQVVRNTEPIGTSLIHCGKSDCFFCVSRRAAFAEAEIKDPTWYSTGP